MAYVNTKKFAMKNEDYVVEMACLLLMYPTDECVDWDYYVQKGAGYGLTRYKGVTRALVHRISLEIKLGRELVDGEFALHRCDRRICFSPSHLFLGNAQDNYRDMVSKKRGANRSATAAGRTNPKNKLSFDQVKEILQLVKEGHNSRDAIGAKYGVSGAQVNYLVKYNGWKNQQVTLSSDS